MIAITLGWLVGYFGNVLLMQAAYPPVIIRQIAYKGCDPYTGKGYERGDRRLTSATRALYIFGGSIALLRYVFYFFAFVTVTV